MDSIKKVEYIFYMADDDTRIKKDVDSARDFARGNRAAIQSIERRVLDHDRQMINEGQTKVITVDDLLNKDMRKI